MTNTSTNKKGFTIIEVSLVIAIAGLIFLMVFVALPGLRSSQRNAQRRDDVLKLISEIKEFQNNNRGGLPNYKFGNGGETIKWLPRWDSSGLTTSDDGWAELYYSYLGKNFVDPSGNNYTLHIAACNMSGNKVLPSTVDVECSSTAPGGAGNVSSAAFPNNYTMSIVTAATCYADQAVGSSNPRKVAVLMKLEGAGVYCANT